jgi:hypothetical protein
VSDLISKLAAYLAPATLQFDLAAAAIAVIALLFSVVTFRQQRRISLETLRTQRDNDVIGWVDQTIDILVGIEFFLRDSSRYVQPMQFGARRDEFLAQLSAAIDKGRLYFPIFSLDVITPEKPLERDGERDILNHLVRIYDLIRDLDPGNAVAIEGARHRLLLQKRAFMSDARDEVEPQRRRDFVKR